MDPVLLEQIGTVLLQLIKMGVQYGPKIVADLEAAWIAATSGVPITPEQQAKIDATLDSANQALADADAAKLAQDTLGGSNG